VHAHRPVGRFFERDFGRGLHGLGSELGLAENERQSHREAGGMSGRNKLFGVGALAVCKAVANEYCVFDSTPLSVEIVP
jgi:hypothetical protein